MMSFAWAITSLNKLRGTWRSSDAYSASTEATGYPKENAVDGNPESEWRASASPANIVLDTGEAAPDYDYLVLRFDYSKLPTAVNIQTSDAPASGFAEIDNNYDCDIDTTLTAAADRASRVISVATSTNFEIGNTVTLDDGVETAKKYIIVNKGTGWMELDRYPEPYDIGGQVTLLPDWNILALIAAGEQKRYIKIIVTATTPHLLEAYAFDVCYRFDGSGLPLNPMPVAETRDVGNITRSFSGYGIGKMHTGPNFSRYTLQMGSLGMEANGILAWLERQSRFGILMDNGEWIECMLRGNITRARRPSSDGELISWATQITVEEV
jgi:hypothetical protein